MILQHVDNVAWVALISKGCLVQQNWEEKEAEKVTQVHIKMVVEMETMVNLMLAYAGCPWIRTNI